MAQASAAHAPQHDATGVYRFHGFRLDVACWELRNASGARVGLAPAPFRLLVLLIEQRQRVLSKHELMDALWHGVVVPEGALTRAIAQVRHALGGGETATRWVQSERGRGYQFTARLDEGVRATQPQPDTRPARQSGILPAVSRSVEASIERRLRLAQLRWSLTSRQLDVLRGLVNGMSNGDLAQKLQCSLRTVETHMTALLERCDAPSRLSLVAMFWIDL